MSALPPKASIEQVTLNGYAVPQLTLGMPAWCFSTGVKYLTLPTQYVLVGEQQHANFIHISFRSYWSDGHAGGERFVCGLCRQRNYPDFGREGRLVCRRIRG